MVKKVLLDNDIALTSEDFEFVVLQLFKESHRIDQLKYKVLFTLLGEKSPMETKSRLPAPPKVDLENDFDDNLLDDYS